MKGPTTRRSWPCCPGSSELVATSTVASVWPCGTPAVCSERGWDEGSGNGDVSVGKVDLEFC